MATEEEIWATIKGEMVEQCAVEWLALTSKASYIKDLPANQFQAIRDAFDIGFFCGIEWLVSRNKELSEIIEGMRKEK